MKKKILLGLGICLCLGATGCGNDNSSLLSKKPEDFMAAASEETATEFITAKEEPTETVETTEDITTEDEKKDDEKKDVDKKENKKEDKKKDKKKADKKKSNSKLSDNLFDFQVDVNGKVIQLPITAKELMDMGITYENKDGKKLPSNHIVHCESFYDGDFQFLVDLVNFDINELPYEDCYVTGIKLEDYYLKKTNATVTMPKGIELMSSTRKDVEAAYGEPTDVYEDSDYPTIKYSLDYDRVVTFSFDAKEGNILTDIEIENTCKPENFEASEADTESVPEIVKAYKAPTALTDDLFDFVFEFAGGIYELPVPVEELVANGWTIVDNSENEIVEGNGFTRIDMMKDNQTFRASVKNYDGNATTVMGCFVTSVRASEFECNLEMKIANNIYFGMPVEDLEKALEGYEVERDSSSMHDYYDVKTPNSKLDGYEIIVKDGKVIQIDIDNAPKKAALEEKYGLN